MIAHAIRVRPACAADLPALHALVENAYRGPGARRGWTHEADLIAGPRTSLAAMAALLDHPDEVLLAADAGAALAGCVQLSRRPAAAAYLGMLTVDPDRQAAGLGRAIIAAAEAEAVRRFGAARLELSVIAQRTELIAWYQRRGFTLTGERRPFPVPLDPPLTLLVLEKPLAAAPIPAAASSDLP